MYSFTFRNVMKTLWECLLYDRDGSFSYIRFILAIMISFYVVFINVYAIKVIFEVILLFVVGRFLFSFLSKLCFI